MATRREFIKYSLAVGAGLFLVGRADIDSALANPTASLAAGKAARASRRVVAAIPGGTLDPLAIPKYQTPLLIPPQMPRAGILRQGMQVIDYYEISVKQFEQQILPAGLPKTTVWGYGPAKALSPRAPMIYNAPSLTIEANWNRPVRIKWINDLKDANGNYLPHLLPVDPTLHWANPPGGTAARDMRPTFDQHARPLHRPRPHGHTRPWFGRRGRRERRLRRGVVPAGCGQHPSGLRYRGHLVQLLQDQGCAQGLCGARHAEVGPGTSVFQYPNTQRASTIWYHDHTLGMTRLNVYAGPAGFFIIRGGPAGDLAVRDMRTRKPAILPWPAPNEVDQIRPNTTYYEIPIAIQDRAFNADGSLFYPDSRAFFDGIAGPYIR